MADQMMMNPEDLPKPPGDLHLKDWCAPHDLHAIARPASPAVQELEAQIREALLQDPFISWGSLVHMHLKGGC